MAKKDNTLLWVIGLGVGGYLLWEHQKKVAANATSPSVTNPAGAALPTTDAKPVVMLPPSSQVNTSLPVAASAASSAPSTVAINTTGLVPAQVTPDGKVTLLPGQSLALNAAGQPIVNSGIPLVFGKPIMTMPATTLISGLDHMGCEEL